MGDCYSNHNIRKSHRLSKKDKLLIFVFKAVEGHKIQLFHRKLGSMEPCYCVLNHSINIEPFIIQNISILLFFRKLTKVTN